MEINLFDLFKMGVDYGLLLAEQERDSEDLVDAFQGSIIDEKFSAPSSPVPRRLPRTEECREAKLESLYSALDIIGRAKQKDLIITI